MDYDLVLFLIEEITSLDKEISNENELLVTDEGGDIGLMKEHAEKLSEVSQQLAEALERN